MAKRPSDITATDESAAMTTDDRTDLERINDAGVTGALGLSEDDDGSAETEQIKAQIEETRAGLGETIDRIQERLSFANISDQVSEQVSNAIETAKDSVYEATIGKVVYFMKNTGKDISQSSVISAAKENPLPFILIGVGAGLLAYQGFGRGDRRQVRYGAAPRLAGQPRQQDSSMLDTAQGGLRTVKDSVSGAAGTVKDTVSTAAGSLKETVTGAAGSAYEGVARAADATYSSAGDLASKARETAGDLGNKAQETYQHYLEEKPWAIGAVALAAGAAIGMALPSTRYEGELMGEARVQLLNKVSDTATEFVDKAKQAAGEVGKSVTEEAKALTDKTVG